MDFLLFNIEKLIEKRDTGRVSLQGGFQKFYVIFSYVPVLLPKLWQTWHAENFTPKFHKTFGQSTTETNFTPHFCRVVESLKWGLFVLKV